MPHRTPSPPARPVRRASARRAGTSRPFRPGCVSWPGALARAPGPAVSGPECMGTVSCEGTSPTSPQGVPMAKTPLQQLADAGQSVWIDYLSRPFIQQRELEQLVSDGVVGVTSNPTIFQGAIAEGDAYDEQIAAVAATESEPKEIFLALARDDIRAACDVLRPRFDSDSDGWVSLEVDPSLAHDTQGTIAEALRLRDLID